MAILHPLNLPAYPLKIVEKGNKKLVFDIFRKKYVVLTPEEWVRQNFAHYLVEAKHFPASLTAIEMYLKHNNFSRRCDIVLHTNNGAPMVIVECKSYNTVISQQVFEQAAGYVSKLKSPYLIVTNGLQHFCCHQKKSGDKYEFIENIPDYSELSS